jgi:hypothetical protein
MHQAALDIVVARPRTKPKPDPFDHYDQSQNQSARPFHSYHCSKACSASPRPIGSPSYHSCETLVSAEKSTGTKS